MIFKRVNELCGQHCLDQPNIQACSDGGSDFTITRVQMSAKFKADINRGAYVVSEEHDSKCLDLLMRSKHSDIVLFPEYCFSYDCIERIVANKQYWPSHHKLWCLPCQGIGYSAFLEKLDTFEQSGAIVLREGVTSPKQHGNFVNALLYCFIAVDLSHSGTGNTTKLVLLPQLKTQHMADREDKCESYMTLGEMIFVFGEQGGNCLITLLCADVLNPDLTWGKLKNIGRNFILLHPQLNSKPTQSDFQKLRQDMYQGSDRHVYISSNWAKGTLDINNPWSCVYFKHEGDNWFSQWYTAHAHLVKSNPRYLLYGGFYSEKRVSIWYAWTSEIAQQLKIQKPCSSIAVMRGTHDVIALQCLQWECEQGWIALSDDAEQECRCLHYVECLREDLSKYNLFHDREDPSGYIQLLNQICGNASQHYPFKLASKADADRFWELLQAKEDHVHTQLNQNEIPHSPVILFANHNIEELKSALRNMRDLGKFLEDGELPKHLFAFRAGYRFVLSSSVGRPYNIVADDESIQIILAITEDDAKANRFIHDLKRGALREYEGKDNEVSYLICVVARETLSGERRCYPEFDPTITAPERGHSREDITEGGRE